MRTIDHVAFLGINDRGQLHYREWAGNLPTKSGRVITESCIIKSEGSTFRDYDETVYDINPGDTLEFLDGVWHLCRQ